VSITIRFLVLKSCEGRVVLIMWGCVRRVVFVCFLLAAYRIKLSSCLKISLSSLYPIHFERRKDFSVFSIPLTLISEMYLLT